MQYKDQQDILNFEKINDLLAGMPGYTRYLVEEYKANRSSSRTILGYVRDLDTFFYFLETEKNIPAKNISFTDLESVSPLDLTAYKSFLSY